METLRESVSKPYTPIIYLESCLMSGASEAEGRNWNTHLTVKGEMVTVLWVALRNQVNHYSDTSSPTRPVCLGQ